jgi:predicted dinucleotide-binding enzyme
MKDILVVGGGKIGSVVADLLHQSGSYYVTVADRSSNPLTALTQNCQSGHAIHTLMLDVLDPQQLSQALEGRFAVLSAAPYHLLLSSQKLPKSFMFTILISPRTLPVPDAYEPSQTVQPEPSFLSAGLPLVLFPSLRPTFAATLTAWTQCECALVLCLPIQVTP